MQAQQWPEVQNPMRAPLARHDWSQTEESDGFEHNGLTGHAAGIGAMVPGPKAGSAGAGCGAAGETPAGAAILEAAPSSPARAGTAVHEARTAKVARIM